MKLAGLVGVAAVAAVVGGVFAAGWRSPGPDVQPTTGSPPAAPTSSTNPSGKIDPRTDLNVGSTGGLNIRYLGKDGKTERLDVKDFRPE